MFTEGVYWYHTCTRAFMYTHSRCGRRLVYLPTHHDTKGHGSYRGKTRYRERAAVKLLATCYWLKEGRASQRPKEQGRTLDEEVLGPLYSWDSVYQLLCTLFLFLWTQLSPLVNDNENWVVLLSFSEDPCSSPLIIFSLVLYACVLLHRSHDVVQSLSWLVPSWTFDRLLGDWIQLCTIYLCSSRVRG